jgi:dTDP-4-amino-4,6-dideoxygalactose transaminase
MGSALTSFLPYRHWTGDSPEPGGSVEDYFKKRSGKATCTLTPSGSAAISLLMRRLRLEAADEVYITTTFEYPNVSSCVTSTIFNYCKPARVFTKHTRAILVIHEFGVMHRRLSELRRLADSHGIPLIEDCAHTLDSRKDGRLAGTVGDFTICSFPKIFPVAYGGALLGSEVNYEPTPLDLRCIDSVRAAVSPHLLLLEAYSEARRRVYRELTRRLVRLNIPPLFETPDEVAPWFFPVPTTKWQECIERSEEFGVECALWHGSNVIVLPCHQFLDSSDVERINEFMEAMRDF